MTAAEWLIDYTSGSTTTKTMPNPSSSNHGGGKKQGKPWQGKSGGGDVKAAVASKGNESTGKKPLTCWLCNGLHKAFECFHCVNTTMEEHKKHLEMVFQKLRENQLYVKREKCAFAQTRINFLGHIIERGQIRMDMKKVRAIQEWKTPANVKELRSFLGLANYYRRFLEEYSKTVAPLTELLKNCVTWDWGIVCKAAF
ncbi:hypothetical protein UlMin_007945 [Ulmus minor]